MPVIGIGSVTLKDSESSRLDEDDKNNVSHYNGVREARRRFGDYFVARTSRIKAPYCVEDSGLEYFSSSNMNYMLGMSFSQTPSATCFIT
jgi:hypothetical protein